MTLRDQIASDASVVFLSTSDFAETVTYIPYQYVGRAYRANRNIAAVIERPIVEVLSQDGEHAIPIFTVYVANSSTLGIASSEIDVSRDSLAFPEREGETATTRRITRMQEHDNGMLQLECR